MLARIAVAIAALIIAFLGVAFIIAGLEIADTPTCEAVIAGDELPSEGECYDGSSTMRTVQTILAVGAGGLGILALIPGFAYAFRNTWLRQWMTLTGAAVVLVVIYAIAGRV
jgi:hypothetical protein